MSTDTLNLNAQGDLTVGGDVVGRDKISTYVGYTAEQVLALIAEVRRADQPLAYDGRQPYLGLASFQEADAEFFFGREKLVDELATRVAASRFICVAGPSGSGKSSLVQAGLIHALRQGHLEGSSKWLYLALTPRHDPIEQLALAVARAVKSPEAAGYLRQHGRSEPEALHRQAEVLLTHDLRQRAVVLVDQFEETFTQTKNDADRQAFIRLLTRAAQQPDGRVTVILALRSDFVSQCALFPELRALMSQQFQLVGAMEPAELARAVLLPALAVGVTLDPALVSRVIEDMKGEPGALPLMQFALKDLFAAKSPHPGESVTLTLADYLERGGIQEALERHANGVFAGLAGDQQQIARDVFSRLIEVGRGTVDTRRTAVLSELISAGVDPGRVDVVVQRLADARLVTTDEQADTRTVTIAHEKLIEAWPWLRKLVNDNRDRIALQNQVAEDAQDWAQHGRDPSYLYAGARLAAAREQLAAKRLSLPEVAQAFVDASLETQEAALREKEAERQRELEKERRSAARLRQRNRVITGIGAVAVVASIVAVWFGIRSTQNATAAQVANTQSAVNLRTAEAASTQAVAAATNSAAAEAAAVVDRANAERQSRLAVARELAVRSADALARDPELGLLLAMEAVRTTYQVDGAYTAEADVALYRALTLPKVRKIIRDYDSPIVQASFSPDGTRFVTVNADAPLLFDADGQFVARLRAPDDIGRSQAAYFSPDGKRVATTSSDGRLWLWDAVEGNFIAVLVGHTAGILDVDFSPDGRHLVTASEDQTARLWEVDGGLVKVFQYAGWVRRASYNSDGGRILTASDDGAAQLWDASGSWVADLGAGLSSLGSASFSLDGTRIVIAGCAEGDGFSQCSAGLAQVWDARTGQRAAVLEGPTGSIDRALFSPDGTRLITSSRDGTARVWDATSGRALLTLPASTDFTASARVSPAGRRIVTLSNTGGVQLWDADTGAPIASLAGDSHSTDRFSADFSPSGAYVLTTQDGTIYVWDAGNGRRVATLEGHQEEVAAAQFDPSERRLLTAGCEDYRIDSSVPHCSAYGARLWDVAGSLIQTLQDSDQAGIFTQAAFGPDRAQVILARCKVDQSSGRCSESTLQLWNANDGRRTPLIAAGRVDTIFQVSASPDGTRLAAAACTGRDSQGVCASGLTQLWDVSDGQVVASLREPGQARPDYTVHFSPAGTRIVTGGADGVVRLWDRNGDFVRAINGDFGGILLAAFSPDGGRVVVANVDNIARIWDVNTGELVDELAGHTSRLTAAEFSPDGARLVTASDDGAVQLWRADTGDRLLELKITEGSVRSVDFSADGTRMVTVTNGDVAQLWNTDDGTLIAVLRESGSTERIRVAHFNRAGTRLITAGCMTFDPRTACLAGIARLWNLSGSLLVTVEGHSNYIRTAGFSPDGTRLVTADDDGTVRLWEVWDNLDAMLSEAIRRVGRSLTEAECQQYLHRACP